MTPTEARPLSPVRPGLSHRRQASSIDPADSTAATANNSANNHEPDDPYAVQVGPFADNISHSVQT